MSVNEAVRVGVLEAFADDAARLCQLLASVPRFRVSFVAKDLDDLRRNVKSSSPDLVLLALSLLRRGTKSVSVRELVDRGRHLVLLTDQLELATPTLQEASTHAIIEGALDVVQRPPLAPIPELEQARQAFLSRLLLLSAERPGPRPAPAKPARPAPPPPRAAPPKRAPFLVQRSRQEPARLVGVASSAGGPGALARFLRTPLPVPVLVTQHISSGFVGALARMLRESTGREITVAADGVQAEPGRIYLAPDELDLGVEPDLRIRVGKLSPRPPHPNCDALLEDVARLGPAAVGVVLTGMGDDGLQGAQQIKKLGGRVLIQDRESCLVFGMPGAVAAAGLADGELPPEEIARQILEWV